MTETNYICDRCKEPLGLVEVDDTAMLRPWRMSRCKNYRPGKFRMICKGMGNNAASAVSDFEHLTVVRLQ